MFAKTLKITLALLLILWMALIFSLSAETASESIDTSAGFTYRVFCIAYPDFEDMTPEQQQEIIASFSHPVRKAAHFSIYLILGVLSASNLMLYSQSTLMCGGAAWFFSTLYAATDEIHQLYVPGRGGQLLDVCIDSLGALLGITVISLIVAARRRKKAAQETEETSQACSELNSDNKAVQKMRKKELIKCNTELFEQLEQVRGENKALTEQLSTQREQTERLEAQIAELRERLEEKELELEKARLCAVSEPMPEEPSEHSFEPETVDETQESVLPCEPEEECAIKEETVGEDVYTEAFGTETVAEESCAEEEILPETSSDALQSDFQPQEAIAEDMPPEKEEEAVASVESFEGIPEKPQTPDEDIMSFASDIIGKIVINAARQSNALTVGGDTRYKELVNLILGRTEVAKAEILDIAMCKADNEHKRMMITNIHDQALEYFANIMAQI